MWEKSRMRVFLGSGINMKLYIKSSKLNQRKKEEYRKKFLIWSSAVLGSILIIGIFTWGVLKIPYLRVEKVEVLGLKPPTSDELAGNLENFFEKEYFISRITGKENILFWRENIESFLKTNPEYENIVIEKDYFTHKINIQAKEREKFGLWCKKSSLSSRLDWLTVSQSQSSEGDDIFPETSTSTNPEEQNRENVDPVIENESESSCWWFDREGTAFASAPVVRSELFNRVEDFTQKEIVLGGKVLEESQFYKLVKIYEVLSKAKVNSKTVYINELDSQEARVESLTDPEIYFSLHNDPDFAIYPIEDLKNTGKWNNLQYVDFRVLNRAYYR